MPKGTYDNILSYLKDLIESYPERPLRVIEQESPKHLRFIPKNLDIDNNFIEDKIKSIKKTGLKYPDEIEHFIKRAVYLEFKAQNNSLKLIIVSKPKHSREIIEISKQFFTIYPTLFEGQTRKRAQNNYFHIHKKTIISDKAEYNNLNNMNEDDMKIILRKKFIEFVPEFLKKLDLFYPINLL